jgi:hypothetical protein
LTDVIEEVDVQQYKLRRDIVISIDKSAVYHDKLEHSEPSAPEDKGLNRWWEAHSAR